MEGRRYYLIVSNFIWASAILYISLFTRNTHGLPEDLNTTIKMETKISPENVIERYVWSTWGSWSPCSKSCGGGVAVQERRCVPNASTRSAISKVEGTLAPPVISVRVGRQAPADCKGVARRFHECNNKPCPGSFQDTRAQQCAAFDRRPFRGRFYTWVPYVDGASPCTLNCRPLGQQFYASLAIVADGTPCTKPGFRAICVEGVCKVVGRESVLASASSREVRCGRRLVSGLFSRPRLPLGYSHVTTVPRGACRLNVSELLPSDNYIALKVVNGSYIVNGEFAVSTDGAYEAAGARFLYTRHGGRDSVFARGPIQEPIDIMILYQHSSPSIKYEYFTDPLPGEAEHDNVNTASNIIPEIISTDAPKHIHRHHNVNPSYPRIAPPHRHPGIMSESKDVSDDLEIEQNQIGGRKFIWKVVSYGSCSRSCGGGIQLGKFRCVERSDISEEKEVSSVYCGGAPPAMKRRRCGIIPCPPRWRSAAWSTCPVCGPAKRTRIVGCVQDNSNGITKINDKLCPSPKPATSEICDIPDCVDKDIQPKPDASRTVEHTDTFREGPVYTVSVNSSDNDIGPEYSFNVAGGWLYTEWSQCVGWCVGGGIKTRSVLCADPAGCEQQATPEISKSCKPQVTCGGDGQWFTGEWSPCSSRCGGRQVRGAVCVGGGGRRLRDDSCKGPKPETQRDCADNDCSPVWYFSEWGQCTGSCTENSGVSRRTVWCARADLRVVEEAQCAAPRPPAQRACAAATPRTCKRLTTDTNMPSTTTTTSSTTLSIPIEAQRKVRDENTGSQESSPGDTQETECSDRLRNCALAVQARLCHYVYYTRNCCNSCKGR